MSDTYSYKAYRYFVSPPMSDFKSRVRRDYNRWVQRWGKSSLPNYSRRSVRVGPSRLYKTKKKRKLAQLLAQPIEIGFHDTITTGSNLDASSGVLLLNGLARGDSATTRQGNRVNMVSLYVRMTLVAQVAAKLNRYRVVVVYDRTPNKAALTHALVFDQTTPESMLRVENTSRFKIVASWYGCLMGSLTVSDILGQTDKTCFSTERFIDLKNLPVRYDSDTNTGLIDEIIQGSLFLVHVGSTGASTAAATIVFTSRLRYSG